MSFLLSQVKKASGLTEQSVALFADVAAIAHRLVTIDTQRYYVNELDKVLDIFQSIVDKY